MRVSRSPSLSPGVCVCRPLCVCVCVSLSLSLSAYPNLLSAAQSILHPGTHSAPRQMEPLSPRVCVSWSPLSSLCVCLSAYPNLLSAAQSILHPGTHSAPRQMEPKQNQNALQSGRRENREVECVVHVCVSARACVCVFVCVCVSVYFLSSEIAVATLSSAGNLKYQCATVPETTKCTCVRKTEKQGRKQKYTHTSKRPMRKRNNEREREREKQKTARERKRTREKAEATTHLVWTSRARQRGRCIQDRGHPTEAQS